MNVIDMHLPREVKERSEGYCYCVIHMGGGMKIALYERDFVGSVQARFVGCLHGNNREVLDELGVGFVRELFYG